MKKIICISILSLFSLGFLGVVFPKSNIIGHAYANEATPTTNPEDFENVRRTPAKRHKTTLEIWELDRLHKDHYEVYKDKRDYEKGKRKRSVWTDGRLKENF